MSLLVTPSQPIDGDLTAIAEIAGTSGLLKKTAANTWSLDTTIYIAQAGADGAMVENKNTITTNYTITTGSNAMSAGPITINSGVTVTVPTGSTWAVV